MAIGAGILICCFVTCIVVRVKMNKDKNRSHQYEPNKHDVEMGNNTAVTAVDFHIRPQPHY